MPEWLNFRHLAGRVDGRRPSRPCCCTGSQCCHHPSRKAARTSATDRTRSWARNWKRPRSWFLPTTHCSSRLTSERKSNPFQFQQPPLEERRQWRERRRDSSAGWKPKDGPVRPVPYDACLTAIWCCFLPNSPRSPATKTVPTVCVYATPSTTPRFQFGYCSATDGNWPSSTWPKSCYRCGPGAFLRQWWSTEIDPNCPMRYRWKNRDWARRVRCNWPLWPDAFLHASCCCFLPLLHCCVSIHHQPRWMSPWRASCSMRMRHVEAWLWPRNGWLLNPFSSNNQPNKNSLCPHFVQLFTTHYFQFSIRFPFLVCLCFFVYGNCLLPISGFTSTRSDRNNDDAITGGVVLKKGSG